MNESETLHELEPTRQERTLRTFDAVLTYLILCAVAVAWLAYTGGALDQWFPVSSFESCWAALVGVGVGVSMVCGSHLTSLASQRFRDLEELIASLIGSQSFGSIFILALVSSVGEEAFFRGAMQPHVGLWGTSLIFGALHGLPGTKLWVWGVFAFFAGLCFGALADTFESLWAPTLAHFTVNFVNLHLLIRKRARGFGSKTEDWTRPKN